METIVEVISDMRKASSFMPSAYMIDLLRYADRIEAAWAHTRKHSMYCTAHNCKLREIVESATDCNQHETVDIESRCIYGAAKDAEPVGNAAKMREALVKIYNVIRSYCFDYGAGESHESLVDRILDDPPDYTSYRDSILEIDRIVEAALSEPRRNCDVGTAEEQATRFEAYCDSHTNCAHCPLRGQQCVLAWAQMPYETVKTKTKTNKGE